MQVSKLMSYYSDIPKFLEKCGGPSNVLYGLKEDGYRCEARVNVDAGTVEYLSRSRKTFPNFGAFDESFLALGDSLQNLLVDGCISFDCEVVGKNNGKSDEVTTQVRRKHDIDTSIFRFKAFDLIVNDMPFWERYLTLQSCLEDNPQDNIEVIKHFWLPVSCRGANATQALYNLGQAAFRNGLEGFVLKDAYGPYEQRRSWTCCKLVAEKTADLKVAGVEEGTGKLKGKLGRFICELPNGKTVKVGPGRATQEQLGSFLLDPPSLIEVLYKEKTSGGSLRHPRFKRVRKDKDEPNLE